MRAHSEEWTQLTDVVKWYGEGACQADPDEADSPIEAHDDYPIQRTLPLEDIDRGYKGYKGKDTWLIPFKSIWGAACPQDTTGDA